MLTLMVILTIMCAATEEKGKVTKAFPKPLYPGLYGWQIAYQLPDRSVVFCSCFQEAWGCYFGYLQKEFSGNFKRAFSRFAGSVNPEAVKAYFPDCHVVNEPQIIDGKEFFFRNRNVTTPKLDETFWKSPGNIFRFENKICEVCNGRTPKHYYCNQIYGSPFAQVYGAWIRAELIRQGYFQWPNGVEATARRALWNESENKIRAIVGIPLIGEQFISETLLFKTVAYLLNDHEVIHHYRSDWLGRQELDIFVPSLKLAIEYQGEQHFKPVDAWGGKDALKEGRRRDAEKRRKCERAGVKLIYFDYTMELTEIFVARQIKKAREIMDGGDFRGHLI